MVNTNCAIYGCSSSSKRHKDIKFHKFPNGARCEQWISACRRPDLREKKLDHMHVCSLHFEEWMYHTKHNLKKTAIPVLHLPSASIHSVSTQTESPKVEVLGDLSNRGVETQTDIADDAFGRSIVATIRNHRDLHISYSDRDINILENKNEEISSMEYQLQSLVFNQRGKSQSTGTTEDQPSTSAAAELQYQPSRYAMVSGNQADEGDALEEIIIKEEISDEDRNQCRLCLSVGRRMQELGDYAPLYRKLLFENNFQNTTIPSFMYQMLACWECLAELRRVKRFQDKVRRANVAFETNQNQKSENMSNLSTIIIGEYNNANAGDIGRVSGLEACAQDIKEEAIEAEVEETSVPDPLEVGQDVDKTEKVVIHIEPEPNITQKVAKRSQPQPKPTSAPKRPRIDQNDPNTFPDQENNPKPSADTESAIFAKVKIEIDELEKILAERRNKESFKAMKFKCDSCILGFTDQYRLRDHNKNFHDEDVGSCECDICERRFDDESQMQAHFRNHFVKFVCKLCQFECYTKTGRTVHHKRHASPSQGSSLLEQRLTSKQQAATSGSSLEPST